MSVRGVTLCGMASELPYTLRNLAGSQSGVVSRSQALRAGLSEGMIKFRVSSGRWQQVHPGVYATFTGASAAARSCGRPSSAAGPGAMLSHETAAELQRLADKPAQMIHVTVPGQRRVRAVRGVSIHRSGRAVEAVQRDSNPPRTRVEETVLDLTQTAATFDDVCGWVTRAFARDLTDEGRLRAAMRQRTKLRWRADLHELIAAAASGDHSVLEYRYDRDVERAHGLPEPVRQAPFAGPDGRTRTAGPRVPAVRGRGRAGRAARTRAGGPVAGQGPRQRRRRGRAAVPEVRLGARPVASVRDRPPGRQGAPGPRLGWLAAAVLTGLPSRARARPLVTAGR